MLSVDLKVEQISHRVDQLNAYIEEILHDQNEINEQHEMADNEISIQIEALNDALDQLRAQSSIPRKRIGFKQRSEAEEEPDEWVGIFFFNRNLPVRILQKNVIAPLIAQ